MLGGSSYMVDLFGQNQFAVTGDAQTVFLTLMFDDDFVPGRKQLPTVDHSFVIPAFRDGSLFYIFIGTMDHGVHFQW